MNLSLKTLVFSQLSQSYKKKNSELCVFAFFSCLIHWTVHFECVLVTESLLIWSIHCRTWPTVPRMSLLFCPPFTTQLQDCPSNKVRYLTELIEIWLYLLYLWQFFNVSAVEANEVFDFRGVRLDWFRLQVKITKFFLLFLHYVTCLSMQVWIGNKSMKFMLLIVQTISLMC